MAEPAPIPVPPEPVSVGTYALYELPDGGRVLAFRPDGQESQQLHFPAPIMRLANRMMNGERPSPMEIMKTLMGH